MPSNKLLKKSRSRTVQDLVSESKPAPPSAADLRKQVHRLEVEIAATSRLAAQRRMRDGEVLPPPEPMRHSRKSYAVQQRLTHAQARRRRTRRLMQAAMFLVSTC